MEYKKLSNIVKDLSYLEINSKRKIELIKENYDFWGKHLEFPRAFENAIKEAKENNLKQDEAYEYLKKSFKKYDNELASKIASQGDCIFGINSNFYFT
ncbi:MAG: hypothetical protein ABIE36_03770 [Candidatus Diapherotrites archaeon]